ncbi:MAG: hypothetical protein P8X81_03535 [Woeseiaceae bacterium]
MNSNFMAASAIALLATSFAANADVRVSTGIEYSSGKYGGDETIEDVYVPFTLKFTGSRLGASITVPYLNVRAPAGTINGPDGQPLPGTGEVTNESGLGDVTANITLFDVYYNPDLAFALDITGAIKFGTADLDKGLGTGENDVSLYLDAYKWFDDFTLLGSLGYRWRGEPADVEFDDVLIASLGGAWHTRNESIIGVMFDYRQSALADADDIQEVTAFGSIRMSKHWQLEIYAFTGFTDSSADWGGGLSITGSV